MTYLRCNLWIKESIKDLVHNQKVGPKNIIITKIYQELMIQAGRSGEMGAWLAIAYLRGGVPLLDIIK